MQLIHDHFVTLDPENKVKSTITLSHKPIAFKNPIGKPVVVRQNLWTIQVKSKTDTPDGVTTDFLELRPKPGSDNNKSKTFPMKVG